MNKSGQYNASIVAAAFQDHITQRFNVLSAYDENLSKMKRTCKYKKPIGKAVIVTRSLQKPSTCSSEKVDYLLNDSKHHKPSLAESLGLIDQPKIIITEQVWNKQKQFAISRGYFALPCPICQDDFKLQPTLLLSCSHVFHRNCIESFERFSNKKSCPICRTLNYEKMVTFLQENIYKSKCASKIRAYWLGYKERQNYQKHCETYPPKSSILNKKWLENKVHQVTDRFLNVINEINVDNFIADMDDTLEKSKHAFEEWQNFERSRTNKAQDKWELILQKSMQWSQKECSICLQSWSKNRNRVILSCSHILHKICLLTFEAIRARDNEKQHICPLCREVYDRRDIHAIDDNYA